MAELVGRQTVKPSATLTRDRFPGGEGVCVCVCVCVCARARYRSRGRIFHILMLEPLLISTLSVSFCQIAYKKIHLDVHYVCCIMLVQRFQQQGRSFTNFHYYYSKGFFSQK